MTSGCRPVTALQRSMLLSSVRAPRSGEYVVQDVCITRENLDLTRLQQAWRRLAEAHPALRWRFLSDRSGAFLQCFEAESSVEWVDTTGELETVLRADCERGFDFAAGPPIRFTLLRTSNLTSTLILTCHHA